MSNIEKSNGSLKDLGRVDLDLSLSNAEPTEMKKGDWDSLVIIADASGSMNESMQGGKNKINAEKDALVNMLKKGMADSRVYLLECPGEDGYPHIFVPTSNPNQLIPSVQTMRANGMTPMYGSLKLAYQKTKGQKVRFILMSDGEPSDCDKSEILALVSKKEVTIDTVGIGDQSSDGYYMNYDPDFLKEIAKLTGGIYTEIHNYQQFIKDLYKLSPAERKSITDGRDKGGAIVL